MPGSTNARISVARRRIAFGRGLDFRQAPHSARQAKHGAGGGRCKGARILYRELGLPMAAAMQGPPVMQSLLQRIKHERRMRRAADAPADDPAGKGINDEGDINKASPGRDGAFSSQAERLAARKMRPDGRRHFQAKWHAWRLGKCDQTEEDIFKPSGTLGGSENATKQTY